MQGVPVEKSHLTQSHDFDDASSGLNKGDPPGDAISYWERRRIVYNVILAIIFAAWIVLTWPHFSQAPAPQGLLFLVIFFAMANLFYSAVYLVDVPLEHSPLKTTWRRWRLWLWLIGTLVAIIFTNYWIADEIYPYVR
jgi:hypothetical protein